MDNTSKNLKDGELELINKYARRPLTEDEVYAFTVVLCDNEIDRDYERFSSEALDKLAKLFEGVTGVMDHDAKSEKQTARIFSCRTDTPIGKKTSDGKPYKCLKARAYMPRTASNSTLITELDSGIKKEVSVGCSVAKRICSICGCDNGSCEHIRGKSYNGKQCFMTLVQPTDAYEWSFVAVPAQRAAGVIKSYKKGEMNMDIEQKLFSGTQQSFSADEINILADRFRTLKEKAADGEAYRRRLETDINKFASIALPELRHDTLAVIMRKMSAIQLEDLSNALAKRAEGFIPPKPQLSSGTGAEKKNYNAFKGI